MLSDRVVQTKRASPTMANCKKFVSVVRVSLNKDMMLSRSNRGVLLKLSGYYPRYAVNLVICKKEDLYAVESGGWQDRYVLTGTQVHRAEQGRA
jgi:hypothetical protein